MSRPFRHAPPTRQAEWLLRPEVQRLLTRRFGTRVTLVRAGAGFGKTTGAAQAVAENRLAPLGVDAWLSCEPEDRSAEHFVHALFESLLLALADTLDRSPTPPLPSDGPDIPHLLELVRAVAPIDVCLVLDDVHHIAPGSAGARALAAIVDQLPANGHLLTVGRTPPPIPLARLEATNAIVEIGEEQLAFSSDESLQVLRALGSDLDREAADRLAGWPALVRLAATSGRVTRFVDEEVLGWLDEEQLRLLSITVAAGEAHADMLAEVSGVDDPAGVLSIVPLVHRRTDVDGVRFAAHDLWHDLLGAGPAVAAHRRSVTEWLVTHDRHAEAVDLQLAADAPDEERLLDALARALASVTPPRPDRLRAWQRALPPHLRDRPEGAFLDGLALRLDDPGGETCRARLEDAARAFVALGRPSIAVGALAALSFVHHVRRDTAALVETFAELDRLAVDGTAEALPYQTLGQALVATAAGRPEAVLDLTAELLDAPLPPDAHGVTLWMHANALTNCGVDATDVARRMVGLGLAIPGLNMVWIGARWRSGRIGDLLDDPMLFGDTRLADGAREEFLTAVWRTIVAVGVGDLATAEASLRTVAASEASETRWQTAGSVLIPRAAFLGERGEVDRARALMQEMLDAHPLEGDGHLYYLSSLCLVYWLLPSTRAHFDELGAGPTLGPLYRRDLRLMQAYVGLVERGETSPLADLELAPQAGELLPALGLSHAAELLAACSRAGNPDAERLVLDLIDLLGERTREAFRRATAHERPEIARGAKDVLERLPVPPAEPVAIALLGGTTLSIGGTASTHPDWRRERVRALLTFLATHPDTTREAVIAALWPDAGPEAGRRNLRSTLNMLNGTLEPGRQGGDAPYFVRSSGQRLALVADEHLSIDVIEFEELLDRAEQLERDGTPSLAIEPLRAAVARYAGDLLPDSYDDWVLFARDRLRARFVGASVRCAELLVALGSESEAVDLLTPALAIEPWSEPAHRALVGAHLAAGDVAAARRAMATCAHVLEEVGGPSEALTEMLARRLDALA